MSCCNATTERPKTNDLIKRINVEDKRLLNCNAVDVNQLMPLKYKWAWEH
jgi:ribonucleoside-diphosphate reductase beta chain